MRPKLPAGMFLLGVLVMAVSLAPVQAQSIAPPRSFITPDATGAPSSGQEDGSTAGAATQNRTENAAPITLEQMEQIALANNPTLNQARANVDAATGRARQAGLWPNPVIGYTGEEIRGGSFGGGEQGAFVEQDIILGGKLSLDRKVLGEREKETEAERDAQRLRVQNGVRIAFYQSLAAQEMWAARQKLGEIAEDAVETTRQLFNVGQADQPDLLEAQVEADEADLASSTAQQEQMSAWRTLVAIAGKPEMPLTRLAGNLEELPLEDPDHMLQAILRDSPAVRIARLEVARADAKLARARRQNVPDLFVRAGYMDNHEQLAPELPFTVGSEGFAEVGVNLPLFDRNQGNIPAAQADRERAELEAQRVSLSLQQQAAPILQDYATSRAAAERYRTRTIPNADEAYQLYLRKYREGAAAYPQVLIAQRTFFQLETAYIAEVERAWVSAAALQGLLLTDGLDAPGAANETEQMAPTGNMRMAGAQEQLR